MESEVARVQYELEQQGDLEEFFSIAEEMDMLAAEYEVRVKTDDSEIRALDDQIETYNAQIAALRANDFLTQEELFELQQLDEAIEWSDQIGSIAEAGAYCVIRSAPNVV